jgi:hypothetical protein
MSTILSIIFALALGFFVALPVLIVMGWVRWARSREVRCAWLSSTGLTLGTASALLAIGTMLYAHLIGGFPFWDPALLRIYRWGSLLSLAGLIFGFAGLRGSGPVRWHAPVAAAGTLLFWICAAAGE